MLAPVRTVAPAATPVSLTEAKAHLRVDHSDDDAMIGAMIEAATAHLDGYTGILGRAMVTQTWRQDFRSFAGPLRLPLGPVASVVSVTYYDSENAQQTLDSSVYEVLTDERGPYLARKPNQEWPGVCDRADAVSVTFVCGVAAASVPGPLKAACLLLVGDLYAFRETAGEGTAVEASATVHNLIAPYRRRGL